MPSANGKTATTMIWKSIKQHSDTTQLNFGLSDQNRFFIRGKDLPVLGPNNRRFCVAGHMQGLALIDNVWGCAQSLAASLWATFPVIGELAVSIELFELEKTKNCRKTSHFP